MSSVVISGNTSGTITLDAPAVAGTTTLTLPATSGTVLTSASNTNFPTGSVLQVVSATYNTQVSTTTNAQLDTGLTATITPKSATSKILVVVDQNGCGKETSDTAINLLLYRNSTVIAYPGQVVGYTGNTGLSFVGTIGATILDSPATTSATTYKTTFSSWQNNARVYVQFQASWSTITLMEIAG
jgi:energy-coupling factor transporter ATP-binding protein EcfA2